MLTEFMQSCLKDQAGWADNVLKTLAAENETNREQLKIWMEKWQEKAFAAYRPIIADLFGNEADNILAETAVQIQQRAAKIGLIEKGKKA